MTNVKNKFCDVVSKTFLLMIAWGEGAVNILIRDTSESETSQEALSLQIHFMKGILVG